MSKIQWYPGHMAKAIRQIKENLKMVDLVLELADARLPESSRNPLVQELIQNKPSLLLLTKKRFGRSNRNSRMGQLLSNTTTTSFSN